MYKPIEHAYQLWRKKRCVLSMFVHAYAQNYMHKHVCVPVQIDNDV